MLYYYNRNAIVTQFHRLYVSLVSRESKMYFIKRLECCQLKISVVGTQIITARKILALLRLFVNFLAYFVCV